MNRSGEIHGRLVLKKVLWPRRKEEERLIDQVVFSFLTKRDLSLKDFLDHGYTCQPKPHLLIFFYRKEPICNVDYLNLRVEAYEHPRGNDD